MEEGERQEAERTWAELAPRLAALCRHLGGNHDRGEELFQRVSVRVVRGLAGYRGDASLLTWAAAIAQREADRLFAQELRESRRREPGGSDVLAEAIERPVEDDARLRQAAAFAAAARAASQVGQLSAGDAAVILARLDRPDATWSEIGAAYSLSAVACAQAHCRGILALRVYIFTHRPDLLGGKHAIEEAFRKAEADADDPLTSEERMAFTQIVIKCVRGYTRRGWREALRAACRKVGRNLEIEP